MRIKGFCNSRVSVSRGHISSILLMWSLFQIYRGHVNAEDGYMRHFHGCLHKKDKHLPQESELIDDNSLADWSRRIQRNVENVRYHVFGSSKYVNYPGNILRHKT